MWILGGFMELLGIEMPFEEFDNLLVQQAHGKELKVINGKVEAVDYEITDDDIMQNRLFELKSQLTNTDYQAIKFAEGVLTEEEYAPIRQQRQEWRDEVNRLEEGF